MSGLFTSELLALLGICTALAAFVALVLKRARDEMLGGGERYFLAWLLFLCALMLPGFAAAKLGQVLRVTPLSAADLLLNTGVVLLLYAAGFFGLRNARYLRDLFGDWREAHRSFFSALNGVTR